MGERSATGFQTRMRLITVVVGLALAAVLMVFVADRLLGGRRPVKRIVLLTIDTLRADALPFHGNPRVKAPNLAAFGARNILFEQAHAPTSWTTPSFVSIHTGLPPHVHGIVQGLFGSKKLPDSVETLAERMQEAGYRTARIGYNPYLSMEDSTRRGYDEQFFYPLTSRDADPKKPPICLNREIHCDQTDSTPAITEQARAWLDQNKDEDFFLWLHYFDPHDPYIPPRTWYTDAAKAEPLEHSEFWIEHIRGKNLVLSEKAKTNFRHLYESEVQYVDHAVGRVVAKLKELGIYEDTLIVITSDHGEEFWEHGGYQHAHTVYREVLHVPLMIKPPKAAAPRRVKQPVSVASVYPTILELCGMAREGDDVLSPSLTGCWTEGGTPPAVPYLIGSHNQLGEPQVAIRVGDLKLIRWWVSKKEELFDLASDPNEQTSVAAERPEDLKRARELLQEYLDLCKGIRESMKIPWGAREELSEEQKRLLKSHGYLR